MSEVPLLRSLAERGLEVHKVRGGLRDQQNVRLRDHIILPHHICRNILDNAHNAPRALDNARWFRAQLRGATTRRSTTLSSKSKLSRALTLCSAILVTQ